MLNWPFRLLKKILLGKREQIHLLIYKNHIYRYLSLIVTIIIFLIILIEVRSDKQTIIVKLIDNIVYKTYDNKLNYSLSLHKAIIAILFFYIYLLITFFFINLTSALFKNNIDINQYQKKFVLYLRPFEYEYLDENNKIERTITPFFRNIITCGDPNEIFIKDGARRFYDPTDEWKNKIIELIKKADFIIIALGSSPNIIWEIKEVVKNVNDNKYVFYLPKIKQQQKVNEIINALNNELGITFSDIIPKRNKIMFFQLKSLNLKLTVDNSILRKIVVNRIITNDELRIWIYLRKLLKFNHLKLPIPIYFSIFIGVVFELYLKFLVTILILILILGYFGIDFSIDPSFGLSTYFGN